VAVGIGYLVVESAMEKIRYQGGAFHLLLRRKRQERKMEVERLMADIRN